MLTTSGSVDASGVARGTVGDARALSPLRDRDAGADVDVAFEAGAFDDRKVSPAGGIRDVAVGLRDDRAACGRTVDERLAQRCRSQHAHLAERGGTTRDRQDRRLARRNLTCL